jgi:hypothetical protein
MKKIIIPCILSLLSHSAFSAPLINLPLINSDPLTAAPSVMPSESYFFRDITRNGAQITAKTEPLSGVALFILAYLLQSGQMPKSFEASIESSTPNACSYPDIQGCTNMTVLFNKTIDSSTESETFARLELTNNDIELSVQNQVTFDEYLSSVKPTPETTLDETDGNPIATSVNAETHIDMVEEELGICLLKSLLKDDSCVEIYNHLMKHLIRNTPLSLSFDSVKRRGSTISGKSLTLTPEVILPFSEQLSESLSQGASELSIKRLGNGTQDLVTLALSIRMDSKQSQYGTLTLIPGEIRLNIRKGGFLPTLIEALRTDKNHANTLANTISCAEDTSHSLSCLFRKLIHNYTQRTTAGDIIMNLIMTSNERHEL